MEQVSAERKRGTVMSLWQRRPRLNHHTVEKLHVAAWVFGVIDVVLVAISLAFSK